MSSAYSKGALRRRVEEHLLQHAAADPTIRLSATSVAQQLGFTPDEVSEVLVGLAHEEMLEPIIIERCESGHLATGTLDDAEEEAEIICHFCGGKSTVRHYVIYAFTPAFITEAAERHRPKILRRESPKLSTLGRMMVRSRQSPPRILRLHS